MSGGGSAGEVGGSAGKAGRSAGRIRELADLSGALTMTLALMVWGASGAAAGGPTSVLVTSPESGQAKALYYSDEQYGKLQQLLGPAGKGVRDKPPEADPAHAHQINVTWLAHDISPWRIDRVFPVESRTQAVWIHTAADVSENTSLNGYWHRAGQPARLRALFKQLGVTGKDGGDGYSGIFPAPWQSAGSAPSTVAPDAGTGTTTVRVSLPDKDRDTDWRWAIAGGGGRSGTGSGSTALRPAAAAGPVAERAGARPQAGVAGHVRGGGDEERWRGDGWNSGGGRRGCEACVSWRGRC
ncbi:hypothetical protein [Streptomyces sp. NPDC101776]|uniref:hypothetical protein n=1 Tax=Streptomyces sp. NPDC101776 TaxID=3366146 RepID=UPI0037F9B6DA